MRDSSHDGFDGAAAIFAEHAKTLRGYIRYQVVQHHLKPFIAPPGTLKVLDIGGGSGIDAAWLAAAGHEVTLIEPSPKQYSYAERRFNFFLSEDQRRRITLVKGTIEALPPDQKFDLVLVHGVAMYQESPADFITSASQHVTSGGVLSLLEKGYYGAESRAFREHKFKAQQSLTQTQRVVNKLGLSTYAFKPEELETILTDSGLEVIKWSGVRVITDNNNLWVSDVNEDDLQAILSAEIWQGADPGIRAQGQMLHFIARRE